MQEIKKQIEFFSNEKYRELPYGTIYYVPGTASSALNEYVKANADTIADHLNRGENNWVTCNIVFLEIGNSLFAPRKNAVLYSAMLPTAGSPDGFSFFAATLRVTEPAILQSAFDEYFCTLQKMFDEILDSGHFKESHLSTTILSADVDVNFSYGRDIDDGIRFCITGKPFPYTEPSRLEITPNTYQVLLPDYKREIHFTAQVKALYVLFLKHPEGIRMKEIADYKEEYKQLYFCLTNRSDTDKLRDSVDKLLDVCNPNALNVKKSQCNAAISCAIPKADLSRYYEIEVNRGLPHKINLDRSLVTLPVTLRS